MEEIQAKSITQGTRCNRKDRQCFTLLIAVLVLPESGVRHPETGAIIGRSPFMEGLVRLLRCFLFSGAAFGIKTGSVKETTKTLPAVGKSMGTMGDYLVLAFVAGQFVAYSPTPTSEPSSRSRAPALKCHRLTGMPMIVAFVLLSACINLFIGSASAKWAIMAPVFVPMLMVLGYSPEFTQLAYRVGDSVTNIISPLMSYFAVIVAFAEKYEEDIGLGTLISVMLPFSLAFLIGWTTLLVIWYYAGLPIGPGISMLLVR